MHLATLKVLCDLAETGSFSLAASKNFVTQSAVSQQIRNLEEHYGWKLIERSKRRLQLTQAGEVVYQAGREIVQKYREIEDSLQTLSRAITGAVQVATVDSVGLYDLSSPLKQYLQTFPHVNVHLEYARGNRIYEDVSRGNLTWVQLLILADDRRFSLLHFVGSAWYWPVPLIILWLSSTTCP